jgi:hypothetical protein
LRTKKNIDALVDVCYEEESFPFDEIYQTGQEWTLDRDGQRWSRMKRDGQ